MVANHLYIKVLAGRPLRDTGNAAVVVVMVLVTVLQVPMLQQNALRFEAFLSLLTSITLG